LQYESNNTTGTISTKNTHKIIISFHSASQEHPGPSDIFRRSFETIPAVAVAAFLMFSGSAMAANVVSVDELLQQVKQGRVKDSEENAARLQEFRANKARQQQLVNNMRAEQAREEQRSAQLEATFETNDVAIIELEAELADALGDLKELFGVLQQAAGDARGNFESSLTQAQYPDRADWLTAFAQKMGSTTRMPTLEEIETLWFELQREMTESGKVLTFLTNVVNAEGEEEVSTEDMEWCINTDTEDIHDLVATDCS